MDIINVNDVCLTLGKTEILKHINVSFEKGKIHGLIGRNGSGKTMLMKCICVFIKPTSGEIIVDGKQVGKDVDFPKDMGIIIETPAAAIISDRLAPMVDFFSVGTNDLTQYTLACDRQNSKIESFCDTHHEAILRLIEMSAQNAHKNGVWIGICGELAADTTLTETFLRMGIDELSVSPGFVLKVRDKVRSIDLSKKD